MPRLLELLEQHQPDVVCLQETKVSDEQFPHDALAEVGYRAAVCCEGRWNGVALLVPLDVEVADVETKLPGAPNGAEARWVEATINGVRVASVYVPNGREPSHPMFQEKLLFLEAMADHAELLVQNGPTVIAGDLNVTLEDRDVWDPTVFDGATHVTPDERVRLETLLSVGLSDAFRAVEPDAEGFTWWDYRMGSFARGMGMRIDFALTSEHLNVESCVVDTTFRRQNAAGDKPSDHAPLVVALS